MSASPTKEAASAAHSSQVDLGSSGKAEAGEAFKVEYGEAFEELAKHGHVATDQYGESSYAAR